MASSIDGKIATKRRGPVKLGSDFDTRRMAEIRAEHDVVVMGAGTYRAHPYPLLVEPLDLVQARRAKGLSDQPVTAVVSRSLSFGPRSPLGRAKDVERLLFAGRGAPRRQIEAWEAAGVSVKVSRGKEALPEWILRELSRAGVERILLEGGGELNALFLEAGLVDRVYLTICPMALGGSESPTFFEGRGFSVAAAPRFSLSACRQVGDELYLIYDRS